MHVIEVRLAVTFWPPEPGMVQAQAGDLCGRDLYEPGLAGGEALPEVEFHISEGSGKGSVHLTVGMVDEGQLGEDVGGGSVRQG